MSAAADPRAVVEGDGFRVTVLTSRLLRLEHHPQGVFVDQPTQTVVNRRFDVPQFRAEQVGAGLDLYTEHLHLHYDGGPFSASGLSLTLRQRAQGGHETTWHHGDPLEVATWGNLGGTTRTLDEADGRVPIDPGLLSRRGLSVVDDSGSLLLVDGWPQPRPAGGQDLYLLGYGLDHQAALRDWFALTGPTPLLPRWVLGNWWSRYHRYSASEYLDLLDRFRAEGLPFSVAVVDMDWHLVDIDPELGSGWTGYTWNRELFDDPAAFLAALHERGLRVSLNVHPADGVRRHEDAYRAMAAELGRDPDDGLPIAFDIGSRAFVDAYLRHLHHPLEAQGVDFWWLDWQSGETSRWPGLDPLWMLNHVHHTDSGRAGRRPLTFSRYAGLGSHRYPIGFSGDTVISWASLAFQPEFTATAANVGYFWWSHDVGGHFFGVKDDELATRWVQLGVLSPINRLHSSNGPFSSKEPWRFGPHAQAVQGRYLRLRHALVPYLYSAMWSAHTDGVGVVRPVYHDHPDQAGAYGVPHEYLLGPDLLVAPVTSPADPRTHLAAVDAWLPEGRWVDLLTGSAYRAAAGGRALRLHRTLEQVPVLARSGAVLPLAADPAADPGQDPTDLVLRVVAGADGGCDVLEDDGSAQPAVRRTSVSWQERPGSGRLTVEPPTGPGALVRRALSVEVVGARVLAARLTVGQDGRGLGVEQDVRPELAPVLDRVSFGEVDLSAGLVLELALADRPVDRRARAYQLLDAAEVAFAVKEAAWSAVQGADGVPLAAELVALDLPPSLLGALLELMVADV